MNELDKAYSIEAGGEISTILSNFSTDFIFNVTDDLMQQRFKSFSILPKPNFPKELEIGFKDLIDRYPNDIENIKNVRDTTYKEIINRISLHSGIIIRYDDDTDLFYLSNILFDLFISNYDKHVFDFFYNFIIMQKESIYNSLNLAKLRKSKDISTMYNRQYYKDQQLAIINANLNQCISFISALDFNAKDTLSYIYHSYEDINAMNYLLNHIDTEVDMFKILIQPVIHSDIIYPSISTSIKLEIQKTNVITNPNNINKENI